MKALLDRDERPTVHKHEEAWKEEERRYDENLPWIVLRAMLLARRLHDLTTQAERPGPWDAWIATGARRPGSLQRMVRRCGHHQKHA